MPIFDGLALVVSIEEKSREGPCRFCALGSNGNDCRKDFKNVHEEADTIANQIYKRFDYDLVQLKDPTPEEFADAFESIKTRLGAEESSGKAFFFAYVGHGIEKDQSLYCMIPSTDEE